MYNLTLKVINSTLIKTSNSTLKILNHILIATMPAKREILYPVFLECCAHTPDNFWEGVFEDLAYGKCPYGTYISKGFLSCSHKKKEFSYKIESKDSEVIYNEVYVLLTEKLCLLSQKDRNKKKNAIIATGRSSVNQEWGSIRKKSIKDMCVEKFVVESREKYNLTYSQARYLLSIIVIALVFKALISKDITYENGKITEIQGISFLSGEMIIDEALRSIDTKTSHVVMDEKKTMSDTWEKYMKELRKPHK
jgi:hypothetical protein